MKNRKRRVNVKGRSRNGEENREKMMDRYEIRNTENRKRENSEWEGRIRECTIQSENIVDFIMVAHINRKADMGAD